MKKLVLIIIASLTLTGCFDYVTPREPETVRIEENETNDKQAVETEKTSESEPESVTEATETETEIETEKREEVTVYVKSRVGVNIRAEASTGSEIIGLANFGESMAVYADTLGYEFAELEYEGGTAYVCNQWVTTSAEEIQAIRDKIADEARRAAESELSGKVEQNVAETETEAESEPESVTEAQTETQTRSNLEYVGCYRITAYMWTGNRMANGVYPEIGYVATGEEFAFGTQLYIEGFGYYTVGDRGVPNGWIDIYAGTYEACCQIGSQYRDVYIVR